MILESLAASKEAFEVGTGWQIKPEGACKGDICVPLRRDADFDLADAAARLRMALVEDADAGVWALGPETLGERALISATAPELVLDDIEGTPFRLSSLKGQKVLLVSWAPY